MKKKTAVKKKVTKPTKEKNPDNKYVMLDAYNLINVSLMEKTLILELVIEIDSSFKYIKDVQLKDLQEQIKKANEKVEDLYHIKFKQKPNFKIGKMNYALFQIFNLKLIYYIDTKKKVTFKLNNYHNFTLGFEKMNNQGLGVLYWK